MTTKPTGDAKATRAPVGTRHRPLGGLALGLAVLSALFAISYFYSPLAYLTAALAVPLGVMARGDHHIRAMGTTAVIIAVLAIIGATAVLVLS